jgi:hypothetical protein
MFGQVCVLQRTLVGHVSRGIGNNSSGSPVRDLGNNPTSLTTRIRLYELGDTK